MLGMLRRGDYELWLLAKQILDASLIEIGEAPAK